ATRRLPDDIERALWDGVARGLIMCDGFEAIRARVAGTRRASRPPRFSYAARMAVATAPAAGRWSLVPSPGAVGSGAPGAVGPEPGGAAGAGLGGATGAAIDGHDLAEAV